MMMTMIDKRNSHHAHHTHLSISRTTTTIALPYYLLNHNWFLYTFWSTAVSEEWACELYDMTMRIIWVLLFIPLQIDFHPGNAFCCLAWFGWNDGGTLIDGCILSFLCTLHYSFDPKHTFLLLFTLLSFLIPPPSFSSFLHYIFPHTTK